MALHTAFVTTERPHASGEAMPGAASGVPGAAHGGQRPAAAIAAGCTVHAVPGGVPVKMWTRGVPAAIDSFRNARETFKDMGL